MVLSMKKARSICADIVEERYPGFRLLADRLADGAYIALWGLGSRRLEVIFACRGNEDIPVYASEYVLMNTAGANNWIC